MFAVRRTCSYVAAVGRLKNLELCPVLSLNRSFCTITSANIGSKSSNEQLDVRRKSKSRTKLHNRVVDANETCIVKVDDDDKFGELSREHLRRSHKSKSRNKIKKFIDNSKIDSTTMSKKVGKVDVYSDLNIATVKRSKKKSRNVKVDPFADEFGTLAKLQRKNFDFLTEEYEKEEEYDDTEKEFVDPDNRPSVLKYTLNLKQLTRNGNLKEAIRLFEEEMLDTYKMRPSPLTYSVLINGCASVGYMKKAFSLFKRMRDRGIKPTQATITGLFTVCANSPFKEPALEKALYLREKIRINGWQLNVTHYHVMIQAFGKCGDIATAFQVADDMVKDGLRLKPRTFNHLLMACISNKNEGLKYAIQVWRKMKQKSVKPDIHSYNLLLRAIKSCNVGDLKDVSHIILGQNEAVVKKSIADGVSSKVLPVDSQLQPEHIPNVLSPVPVNSAVVTLNEMPSPDDRLALFGGMPGLLSQMMNDDVKPNIKTFTQLLDVIPNKASSEYDLVEALEQHAIIPDIDFCNMLIKRKAFRHEDKEAMDVIEIVQKYGLSPNIMTYGVMALSCRTASKSRRLMKDMDAAGHVLNIEIIGSLLQNACIRRDFDFVRSLMLKIKTEEIAANPQILKHFEKTLQSMEKKDFGEEKMESYEKFKLWYKNWLRKIPVDLPQHPWQQYNYKADKYFASQQQNVSE